MSFVHRFGAALNAHVHYFHCCVIDGVLVAGEARSG
ncbi:MAG: transposase [Burkholderiales bacterium]